MTFLNKHSNDHYIFYLFLKCIGEIPKKSSAFSLYSLYNKVKISENLRAIFFNHLSI